MTINVWMGLERPQKFRIVPNLSGPHFFTLEFVELEFPTFMHPA
jgi:hypothetical protein